jgi:putative sigma-54 modulation protein
MEMEIRGLNVQVTESLRTHSERRLGFTLGRFAERVRVVMVRFEDINGHRGGEDQRCRLDVVLSHAAPVHVEGTARDPWVALDMAAQRAGQAVARELARAHKAA